MLNVLIACEYSGRVREAFRKLGHNSMRCDLLEAEDGSPYHLQTDVLGVMYAGWDLMIAHPDCTYLCSSGLHWNNRGRGHERTDDALRFVKLLMDAPVPRIAIENPVGRISTRIRKPDQIIQPYEYGDDASKATCLWLKGLPKLVGTNRVPGRKVIWKGKEVERWANQTDSGQNKLPPSDDRWKDRSRTYQGWADAMSAQWGAL